MQRLQAYAEQGGTLVLGPCSGYNVSRRGHGGQPLDFILNYTSETQTLDVHETATDRLSGQSVQGETKIAPYGVMLLQYE
ncbi:Beta-galactosidase C-terminal domain [Paenibacillus sp. Soil750]|uniref:Beta-galactosidase C-terminal domain n=1 Tax=Paenibacillus sp. Soil750 TaxID=1736398 RepID=UPI000A5EF64B|nr:Beta-galactosidase C-terminal domain [Paenibacillus sp. Soil750]